jgi:uncharacterized protein
MRTLNKDQILDICYGATFLGSGGGGPFKTGQRLVQALPDDVAIEVKTVNEVIADRQDKLTAIVAFIGSPEAGSELKSVDAAVKALELLEKAYNQPIGYVIPIELGGGSTIVPFVVAHSKNIAVIDGDGAGRAVPSLTMTTFAAANLSADPTIIADNDGQSVSVHVKTADEAEAFIRPILSVAAFGGEAGLALWAMDKAALQKAVTIQGTLQLAEEVGHILRNSSQPIDNVLQCLYHRGWVARRLFTGIVQPLPPQTQGGFDFGKVVLRNDAAKREVWVYYQNENLIAWDTQKTVPMIIAPDSICYVTSEGQPFSNADIDDKIVNHPATLIGIIARRQLQTGSILQNFKKSLENLGYAGTYVPMTYLHDVHKWIENEMEKSQSE